MAELPTTDEQIATMISGDRQIPMAAVSFPNWHNAHIGLVDSLKTAYRQNGLEGMRDEILAVATEVCKTAISDDVLVDDRDPTPDEVLATAVRTIAIPSTTRNAFVRSAVSELHYEETLKTAGYTIVDTETVERITGESAYKQERTHGWDISARDPETNELVHFQVKATSDEPAADDVKNADHLIWFPVENGELGNAQEV